MLETDIFWTKHLIFLISLYDREYVGWYLIKLSEYLDKSDSVSVLVVLKAVIKSCIYSNCFDNALTFLLNNSVGNVVVEVKDEGAVTIELGVVIEFRWAVDFGKFITDEAQEEIGVAVEGNKCGKLVGVVLANVYGVVAGTI